MSRMIESPNWYHSNKYTADSACGHCGGVVYHEPWCITCNREVAYAYEALVDAGKLSLEDQLILHALGAAWAHNDGRSCACGRQPQ